MSQYAELTNPAIVYLSLLTCVTFTEAAAVPALVLKYAGFKCGAT
jgi:hypothetical protein